MTVRLAAVFSVLVLGLAGAGGAAARSSTARATRVKVAAKDFFFHLSTTTVPHGRVTFVITNDGHTRHDLAISGKVSKTVEPGKTTDLTVTLKRGRYPYKCTVDSHAELGMKGVLRVT